ncbi:MFS transporter [Rhodoplanes sp. Z2-YC6860]|uniref:MFS transporter n=1 Tax=Rhodoplanes sp. Z2-YC6860 TaxID=674703 RepID=UPI000829B23C|nr:MFS transporter [Rhodoplanes sp. Z2-YC6860]
MTEATDLTFAARRADDTRLIMGVSTAHFVSHFYMLVLPPLFAFVRSDYGLNYTEVGLALTVFMAVSAILQTPAGFLVDRYSARLMLAGGLALGAASLIVAALVNSYWVLVGAFGLLGLANTVYHPADYSLLSRHVAPERMSRAYSIHTFSGLLGGAVAPAAMLALHGWFGWRGAFIGAAVLGCVAAALFLVLSDGAPERTTKPQAGNAVPDTSWRLLLSGPILINFVFFALMAFCSFGFMNFSVVALSALYGTSSNIANMALTGYLFLSALGVLAGGMISARFPRHGVIAAVGMALTGLSALAIGMVDLNAPALITVASGGGFFFGAMLPARDMILRAATPAGAFGKVFGFVTNGFNIGGIVTPLVYGGLLDHGAPRLVFITIAIGAVAAILMISSAARPSAARKAL